MSLSLSLALLEVRRGVVGRAGGRREEREGRERGKGRDREKRTAVEAILESLGRDSSRGQARGRWLSSDEFKVEQDLSRQLRRPGGGGRRDWSWDEQEREFPSCSFWRSPRQIFAATSKQAT